MFRAFSNQSWQIGSPNRHITQIPLVLQKYLLPVIESAQDANWTSNLEDESFSFSLWKMGQYHWCCLDLFLFICIYVYIHFEIWIEAWNWKMTGICSSIWKPLDHFHSFDCFSFVFIDLGFNFYYYHSRFFHYFAHFWMIFFFWKKSIQIKVVILGILHTIKFRVLRLRW